MVLRRPYAFLIKYFKLIHLVLFGFLVYITISASRVLGFFRDYINSNGNMEVISSNYFSPFIVISFMFVIFIKFANSKLFHLFITNYTNQKNINYYV